MAVVAVLAVVVIILAYLLFPVFFGPTTVTSTGDVRFAVILSDGNASIAYEGSADGRNVTDLQIAVLAEGGDVHRRGSPLQTRSRERFSDRLRPAPWENRWVSIMLPSIPTVQRSIIPFLSERRGGGMCGDGAQRR